uniref:SKA complex subunit 1 n=1 Tax=Falco tinnunculus TaxID=100819 RepID=A0A8C4U0T8_FALTI
MKGRLTYDQINAIVQEMNKAVAGEYKILHQPLKSMNAAVRSLYHRFLEEETKDTKGISTHPPFVSTKLITLGYCKNSLSRHSGSWWNGLTCGSV